MSRAPKILACFLLSVPIVVFVACSSSSGGGNSSSCDEGGGDGGTCTAGSTEPFVSCLTGSALQSPTISFKSTIQPLFNQSCAIGNGECHGEPNNPVNLQIYLGLPGDAGTPDASQILSGIVGVTSLEDSKMALVKAGDPTNSYLMHKLDDDQCQFASECGPPQNGEMGIVCGVGMPYSSGILDLDTRDQVRRWIAQGAQNN
jgi:hypothetical protein